MKKKFLKKPVYRIVIKQYTIEECEDSFKRINCKNITIKENVKELDHYEFIEGRSIGGMVTVNVKALQEIINKVEVLETELCKKDNTYAWC